MVWKSSEDWSGRESQKIWPLVVPYTRGRVLDVGAGNVRVFSHWMTLDSGKMYNESRVADIVADGEKDIPLSDLSLDAVFSSHFIEHCVNWKGAVGLWWSKIKPGGHLVLYFPHPDHYPHCGTPGSNPDHKHDIHPDQVMELMKTLSPDGKPVAGGWDCLEDETRIEDSEYSQFMVFRKRQDAEQNYRPFRKSEKSILVIRYGAFGDALLASSILPGLKKQGYHITYNGESGSAAVIAKDPNIDTIILQDKDQVPNGHLCIYWDALAKRYARVINLNESVEGTSLALPGSSKDKWPTALRQKHLDMNYMEFTHDLAGVPHEFAQRFHATPEEKELAMVQRKEAIGERPMVAWVLRGSSVHKVWPYVRAVIARMILKTDAAFMLIGDKSCQDFETAIVTYVAELCGKDACKRVWVTSGELPIRASMVFAAHCADVLVGPETGVLNAAALEQTQKVIFLSHSSQENLTKHWVNTRVLEAFPACRPCHQLHYGWDRCTKDEKTQTAMCQAMITPDVCEAAIVAALADVKASKEIVAEIITAKPEDDNFIADKIMPFNPRAKTNGAAHP